MSLEEAIARVEIEALRGEEARAAAETGPRESAPRQSAPRPVAPVAKDGRGSLSRLWAQMFGRPAERAEPRAAEPRVVEPRNAAPRVSQAPPGPAEPPPHLAGPPPHPKGRDTWLTDLLARASREEDEAGDEAMSPPKIRRVR
jgi:hypothetical protein